MLFFNTVLKGNMGNSDSERKKKGIANVLIIIVFILSIIGAIGIVEDEMPIIGEKKYSIATVFDKRGGTAGIYHSNYTYTFLNKTYYGQIQKGTLDMGNRYIVAFSAKNPKKSKLMYKYQVKINLQAPDSGWSNVPDELIR